MKHPEPTSEGLRRYPETNGYYPDRSREGAFPDPELPCTCTMECEDRCAGECGCEACALQFAEFADEAGLCHLPDDGPMDVEAALKEYREVQSDGFSGGTGPGG